MRLPVALAPAVALCAAFTFATPTASAATLTYDGEPPIRPYQQWADASKVPVAPSVDLNLGMPCPGDAAACATAPATIESRPGQEFLTAATFYHELGHLFDYQVMTDFYRQTFMATMRLTGPWRAAPNSPHEKFADIYSLCARRFSISRAYTQWDLRYGMRWMSRFQFRAACTIIRWAAASARMDPWPAGVPAYRPAGL